MPKYELTVTGTVREVYIVDAESEDEVRECFEMGAYTRPIVSEVLDTEVEAITPTKEGGE